MNKVIAVLLFVVLVSSCHQKDVVVTPSPNPVMRYSDLRNREVKYNQNEFLDLDQDGSKDFSFTTYLIGDPLLKRDRLSFAVTSTIATYLSVD